MRHDNDLGPLDQLVAKLNWDGCTKKIDVTVAADLARLVEAFDQSDHLVQRFPNPQLRKKRDAFVEALVSALESIGSTAEVARVQARLQEGALFEKCLHELLNTLPTTASGKLPPDRHAWAVIERFALQQKAIEAHLFRTLAKKDQIFDPFTFMAEGDDGGFYRPDVLLGRLSNVTASSLAMLAITNGWIDEAGLVELPERSTSATDHELKAVGITEYMGNAFDAISYLVERWRFWGDEVRQGEGSVVGTDGVGRRVKSIIYLPGFKSIEVYDHVATERLNRYIIENLADLDLMGSVDARIPRPGMSVAPAPDQYVSKDEAFAVVALSSLLHFNVLEDPTAYGGLTFREWTRGYAWLRARVSSGDGKFEIMRDQQAASELLNVGFSADAARTFLRMATLHRNRSDLFDTPLVRIRGGMLGYHPAVVKDANLPRIVLSRLSSLEVAIAGKGSAFEQAMLKVLTKAGLPAKSFAFKRGKETYQYDAAFVWGDTLFIFECKSYSVPMSRPMQIFWFARKMSEAVDQVRRLGRGAELHPDEVRAHLGDVTWKSVVTCVVNALPWSLGRLKDGTFILDYSAIGKFLSERTLSLKIPIDLGNVKAVIQHPVKEFWPESGPTAAHFLQAMDTPWQLKSIGGGFTAEVTPFQLSGDLLFEGAFLKRTSSDMVRDLAAIGVPDPTLDMEELRKQLAKLRAAVKTQKAGQKRNKGTTPKSVRGRAKPKPWRS